MEHSKHYLLDRGYILIQVGMLEWLVPFIKYKAWFPKSIIFFSIEFWQGILYAEGFFD